MARLVRGFVAVVSAALLVQGLLGAALKLATGDAGDLAHSAVHAAWGAAGLLLVRRRPVSAAAFATLFGAFYLGLAAVGAASGGLPLLPLSTPDHVFHAVLGAASAVVGVLAWARGPFREGGGRDATGAVPLADRQRTRRRAGGAAGPW